MEMPRGAAEGSTRSGMRRDVEVQNAASVVIDHEEAIELAEPERWNGEEIHGREGFPVIA